MLDQTNGSGSADTDSNKLVPAGSSASESAAPIPGAANASSAKAAKAPKDPKAKRNRTNPIEAVEHISETFTWFRENRGWAGLVNKDWSAGAILRSERDRNTLKDSNDVHRIVWMLCMMGLHEHVEGLINKWNEDTAVSHPTPDKEKEHAQANVKKFIRRLYNLFDEVSASADSGSAASLKTLKKYINAFAENLRPYNGPGDPSPQEGIKKELHNGKKLAKKAAKGESGYDAKALASDVRIHFTRLERRYQAQFEMVRQALTEFAPLQAAVNTPANPSSDTPTLTLTDSTPLMTAAVPPGGGEDQKPPQKPKPVEHQLAKDKDDTRRNELKRITEALQKLASMQTHMYAFAKRNQLASWVDKFEGTPGSGNKKTLKGEDAYIHQISELLDQYAYYLNPDLDCVKALKKRYLAANATQAYTDEQRASLKELNEAYLGETYYIWVPWRANEVTAEKIKKRNLKWHLNNVSIAASYFMMFGEGVVPMMQAAARAAGPAIAGAAALAALTTGAWFLIILVGLGGAIVNYFLSRNSTYTVLREIFIKNDDGIRLLYCNKDGVASSPKKQNLTKLTLATTAMGGLTYGALSFYCMYAMAFPQILGLCGLTAAAIGPAGWAAIAIFAGAVALMTATALFAIFYRGMAKTIASMNVVNLVENTWVDEFSNDAATFAGELFDLVQIPILAQLWWLVALTPALILLIPLALQWTVNVTWYVAKNIWDYLVKTFGPPPHFKHMTWTEFALFEIGALLKLGLTVGAWFAIMCVSIAMAGLFNDKAMKLVGGSWSYATYFVMVLFDYLGSLCNIVFFAQGILGVKDAVIAVGEAAVDGKLGKSIDAHFADKEANPTRYASTVKTIVSQVGLLACVGFNSYGQASGPAETEGDPNKSYLVPYTGGIIPDVDVAVDASMISTGAGSGGPNAISAHAATDTPPRVESPISTPPRSASPSPAGTVIAVDSPLATTPAPITTPLTATTKGSVASASAANLSGLVPPAKSGDSPEMAEHKLEGEYNPHQFNTPIQTKRLLTTLFANANRAIGGVKAVPSFGDEKAGPALAIGGVREAAPMDPDADIGDLADSMGDLNYMPSRVRAMAAPAAA